MDVDLYAFLLDAGFHLLSAVASSLEFIIHISRGLGSKGDVVTLMCCATLFFFHFVELCFYTRHITVRRVN